MKGTYLLPALYPTARRARTSSLRVSGPRIQVSAVRGRTSWVPSRACVSRTTNQRGARRFTMSSSVAASNAGPPESALWILRRDQHADSEGARLFEEGDDGAFGRWAVRVGREEAVDFVEGDEGSQAA